MKNASLLISLLFVAGLAHAEGPAATTEHAAQPATATTTTTTTTEATVAPTETAPTEATAKTAEGKKKHASTKGKASAKHTKDNSKKTE